MKTFTEFLSESAYEIRDEGRTTQVESGGIKFGCTDKNVIGWFSNKYNQAFGWTLHTLTLDEKKEFDINNKYVTYRTYSEKTDTTSIAQFDIQKGKYAFLDNEKYENGILKFERMTKYKTLIFDKKI